jgi:transposase-like protein
MTVGVEASERKRQAAVNSHGKGDINLVNLIERYGSEEKCREYLEDLRWPEGVTCPRCESKSISKVLKRSQYDCNSCRYQFSVKSGTVFHDSHLPLWKWFLATYMMIEGKKGISANQLKRTLAISYKTAWYLCHRIRSAMDVANPELLTGTVEVDETFLGGKFKNRHVNEREKNRGANRRGGAQGSDKTMVLGAISRGGGVRFQVERRHASTMVLSAFIEANVHDDADAVYTDSWRGYDKADFGTAKHETVDHSADEWVRADVHTNTVESVWSILKRSIVGTYHQLSAKHLESYLDAIAFRFNNRHNPYLFRDTLLAMLDAETLTYAELIQTESEPA